MRRSLVLLIMVLCLASMAQERQSPRQGIGNAIGKLKRNEQGALRSSDFQSQPSEAATAFIEALPEVTSSSLGPLVNQSHREDVAQFAVNLEKESCKERHDKEWSHNDALLKAMATNLMSDDDPGVRAILAGGMRELYSPAQLERYGQSITGALHHWQGPSELLLLYGVLPTTNLRSAQEMVTQCNLNGEVYSEAILARFGDAVAEKHLMQRMEALQSTGTATIDQIHEAMVYVGTRSLMKLLAEGLNSDEKIRLAGGGWACKQLVYANVLIEMNKGNPEFPLRALQDNRTSPPKLDVLEEWCVKNLGVEYPKKESRKRCHTDQVPFTR